MKRFLSLAVILLGCIPMGVSIAGCGVNQNEYCDATDKQKVNQPASVVLQPEYSTISLAYTQTRLLAGPQAKNCLGQSVVVSKYIYASSNPSLLDVSPSGNLCSGTWNRNTGGGIGDYTVCSPPTQSTIETLLTEGNNTYSEFYATVTASAGAVASNPVTIYSHPQVSSVVSYPSTSTTSCVPPMGFNCSSQSSLTPNSCVSSKPLTTTGGVQLCSLVCAEALVETSSNPPTYTTELTDITPAAGEITYSPVNASVVTIGTTGLANANYPGSTVVTANVSGVTATAGLFSTCPPASMQLFSPNSTTPTFVNVAQGNSQQLTLNTTDTTGATIALNGLTFTSATPSTISIGSTGSVAPIFGGNADVYAACQPPACNPSPLDYLGLFGNGNPLVSNPVRVNAPGTVSSLVYMVNYSNGPYFSVLNTNTNVVTTVTMPYQPNSMAISQDGSKLYFGSATELMAYTTANLALVSGNLNVPGTVLAVSPDGTTLIISGTTKPQAGQPAGQPVVYIYTVSTGNYLSQGTVSQATRAQYAPDGTIAYITAGNQQYIYSQFTGWNTQPTETGVSNENDLAVIIPPVGAFVSGTDTQAASYCATNTATGTAYYPPAADTGVSSDRLGISNDGLHLFAATGSGSAANPLSFSDVCVSVPPNNNYNAGVCSAPVTPVGENPVSVSPCPIPAPPPFFTITTNNQTYSTAGILPVGATLTGIPVATSSSVLAGSSTPFTAYTAFLTYDNGTTTGAGAVLPYYQVFNGQPPPASVSSITLTSPSSATPPASPTAGVVSSDSTALYVTTSGDNMVHIITIPPSANGAAPASPPYENTSLNPPVNTGLLSSTGNGYVPADAMVIRAIRTN